MKVDARLRHRIPDAGCGKWLDEHAPILREEASALCGGCVGDPPSIRGKPGARQLVGLHVAKWRRRQVIKRETEQDVGTTFLLSEEQVLAVRRPGFGHVDGTLGRRRQPYRCGPTVGA